MTADTLDGVGLRNLERLLHGDCLCEIPQQYVPHPCSSHATHAMRFRCGGYRRSLVCARWVSFFEGSLVPDRYCCSFCRMPVAKCWEFLPI